jgi:hypothetical protein
MKELCVFAPPRSLALSPAALHFSPQRCSSSHLDSDRLVTVLEASPKTGWEGLLASARIEDWNRMKRTFEAISCLCTENVTDTSRAPVFSGLSGPACAWPLLHA